MSDTKSGASSTEADMADDGSVTRGKGALITVDGDDEGDATTTAGNGGLRAGGSSGPAHMMTKSEHDQHEILDLLKVGSAGGSAGTTTTSTSGSSRSHNGGTSSYLEDKEGAVAAGGGGLMGTLSSAAGEKKPPPPNHGLLNSAMGRKSGVGLVLEADA
jgi:hypothetical protein